MLWEAPHNTFVFVFIDLTGSSPSVYLHLPILSYWKIYFSQMALLFPLKYTCCHHFLLWSFTSVPSPFHSPNNFFLPLNILSRTALLAVSSKAHYYRKLLFDWFCCYQWQPSICNICYVCPFWKISKFCVWTFFF